MDTRSLAKDLKKKSLATAYCLSGEESALVDRALELITKKALSGKSSDDFSLTRLDGKTSSFAEVEAACRTGSLFGGWRLVILRDAQQLRPAEQKKLAAYLANPVPSATMVVVVRGAGPSTRNPKQATATRAAKLFHKAVGKGGGVSVDCPRPKSRELPKLARQLLKEQLLEADKDGLFALVDAVGEDLTALIQAIDKLVLYKGGQGQVRLKDVDEVVADTRSQSVFDLTDAVAEGKLKVALSVLRRMNRDGESALAVLGHLARHFRNLAVVQALSQRGEPLDSIRSQLGLHPFVVKKSLQQSQRFTPKGLARRVTVLAGTDRMLKGGPVPDELQLEMLVVDLCKSDVRR